MRIPRHGLIIVTLATLGVACSTTPDATELPADEGRIEVEPPAGEPERPPASAPETAGPAAPELDPEPAYRALELDGVRGGELTFRLPGGVEDVAAMLLDFDAAAEHRAWADRYRTIERTAVRVVTEWDFKGKMGINPTVRIELTLDREAAPVTIRYKLVREDFGLAAFFGDYRLSPVLTRDDRTDVIARVFIDSGLWLANATKKEIEEGLREDARLMHEWMIERLRP